MGNQSTIGRQLQANSIQQLLETEPQTLYAKVLRCQKLLEELLMAMDRDPTCPFTMLDATPRSLQSTEELLEDMRQSIRRHDRKGFSPSPVTEELYQCRLLLAEAQIRGRLRLLRGRRIAEEATG